MNENTTKGEKMDKERIAELRLLERHLRASGQMAGAVIGELLDALEAALARAEGVEALRLIARECSDWIVQPHAGARSECYFCGNPVGVHDGDCLSLRASRALHASTEPRP